MKQDSRQHRRCQSQNVGENEFMATNPVLLEISRCLRRISGQKSRISPQASPLPLPTCGGPLRTADADVKVRFARRKIKGDGSFQKGDQPIPELLSPRGLPDIILDRNFTAERLFRAGVKGCHKPYVENKVTIRRGRI